MSQDEIPERASGLQCFVSSQLRITQANLAPNAGEVGFLLHALQWAV